MFEGVVFLKKKRNIANCLFCIPGRSYHFSSIKTLYIVLYLAALTGTISGGEKSFRVLNNAKRELETLVEFAS